jgi:hypothetical protein
MSSFFLAIEEYNAWKRVLRLRGSHYIQLSSTCNCSLICYLNLHSEMTFLEKYSFSQKLRSIPLILDQKQKSTKMAKELLNLTQDPHEKLPLTSVILKTIWIKGIFVFLQG